jgi:superfamily I DNA and/or RNA helicase
MIFKIDEDKFLIYNEDKTTKEISKESLTTAVSKPQSLPTISDKELLEWARLNHPLVKIKEQLDIDLKDKQSLLEEINKL